MRLGLSAERRRSLLQFGLSGAPATLGGVLLVVWLVKKRQRRREGHSAAQHDGDTQGRDGVVQDEVGLPPSRQHPRSCKVLAEFCFMRCRSRLMTFII